MAWTRGADGLRATGTLFAAAAQGGARLRVADSVAPGSSYYLVLRNAAVPTPAVGVLPIPPELRTRELPPLGAWKAWQIDMPATVDDRVRTWCLCLGHPVGEPPYLLELISPPPCRYSDSGLPIIERGHEAIIAVHPPLSGSEPADTVELLAERDGSALGPVAIESTSVLRPPEDATRGDGPIADWWNGRPGGTVYLAWPITHEGVYRLRAATGRAIPLTFAAVLPEQELDPTDVVTEPAPLEVVIAGGGSEVRVRAFQCGSGPHEIDLSAIGSPTSFAITVRCPVPVDVSWSSGQIRGRSRRVCPEEVHDRLAADLREGLSSGRLFMLQVDAGNFGRLRMHLLPATTARLSTVAHKSLSGAIALPAGVAQRARWLRRAVPAFLRRPDVTAVPLPGDVRAALAEFEDEAGVSAIAESTVVPLPLMPHLRGLTQAIDRHARSRPDKGAQSTDHRREASSMSQGDESPGSVRKDTS